MAEEFTNDSLRVDVDDDERVVVGGDGQHAAFCLFK